MKKCCKIKHSKLFFSIGLLIVVFSSCSLFKQTTKTPDNEEDAAEIAEQVTAEIEIADSLSALTDSTESEAFIMITDTTITAEGDTLLHQQLFKITGNDTVPLPEEAWPVPVDSTLLPNHSPPQDSVTELTISADAVDAKIEYSARDSILLSIAQHKVFLYGEAQINYKDIQLKAGYIEFNMDSNLVYARGVADSTGQIIEKPVYTEGEEEFLAEEMRYNFETKRGIVTGVFSEQSGGYLHSAVTKMHEDGEIHLRNGKYTTCNNPDHPHYYFAMTKAIVVPNDKIVSGPLYFVLADVPTPIALPFGYFPNQNKQHSGILIPSYGEDNARGFNLQDGGYYFAINDYMDLALTGDIYSKGSWSLRAESNYIKRYKFNGHFNAEYSNLVLGDEGLPDYQKSKEFWIDWTHSEDPKAHPNSSFNASVRFGTSSFQEYNSTNSADYLSNEFGSSVSYTKRWPNSPFNFSANLRHNQNTQSKMVTLSLPEMTFTMNRIYPFERQNSSSPGRWYEKISLSYTSNLKNTVSEPDSIVLTPDAEWKYGFQHSIPLGASYKFWKFFSFNPQVDYKGVVLPSYLNRYMINDSLATDTVHEFRYAHAIDPSVTVSFSPQLFGMYQMKNPGWLQAVRHVMSPSVSFSYKPDLGEDELRYKQEIQVDTTGHIQQYSIFSNGVFTAPQAQGEYGRFNFSLGNNLEMKVRDDKDTTQEFRKIKLLDRFNFSTGYDMFADSLNWSNLSVSAGSSLLDIINLNASASYSFYDVDSTGTTINAFLLDTENQFMRLNYFDIGVGMRLSSGKFQSTTQTENEPDSDVRQLLRDDDFEDMDVDFSVPWNLRIDYKFRVNRQFNVQTQEFESTPTQTLRFSGDITLTRNWKIGFSSGYDFDAKKLTYTTANIYRDLHCWEMRFSWVPFGTRQSYTFQINIKSSILQDVKWKKNKSWWENN